MTEITETPAAQAPETPTTNEATVASDSPSNEEATNQNGSDATEDGGAAAETNGDEREEDKPEPPKEMRAIVLTGFGGLKGVKVLKKPEPNVQAGEVLIRVKAW